MQKLLIITTVLLLSIAGYVVYVNRDSMQMTTRQKMLKAFYPVLTGLQRWMGGLSKVHQPTRPVLPRQSLYALDLHMIDGSIRSMAAFKGKKLLLVNTASDCGYTAQYAQLQELQDRQGEELVVIGFPANDFKEQEKGDDASIAAFCKRNYGVSFPLASKSSVLAGTGQNPIFQWLSDPAQNGWNNRRPSWNFMKYLVSEEGTLEAVFEPAVDPAGEEISAYLAR